MKANNPDSSRTTIWALLVGIDEYKAVSRLRGCANDVEAMRTLLTNRYAVPEDQIRVLINAAATRANIIREFHQFLIENPRIQYGDQILFHYSGHGSQMPAGPGEFEPDGRNETLVPHDSRSDGVFDIPDKTVAALLDRLAASKGDRITVVLDSCHSGSGTRAPWEPSAPRVRRVPADDRIPPAGLDVELRTGATRSTVGPAGWATAGLPYVLLAGCRDREESNEYEAKFEDARVWLGALTYFTLQVLEQLSEGATYAELHERVAALVNAQYRNQMPQCEGDRSRTIFGSVRIRRDPFIAVRSVDPSGKSITLSAGLVHGLCPGTKLALYPPEVRTRADLPALPLATVEVKSVAATTAHADVDGAPAHPIPQHARGVITQRVYSGLRQTVSLGAADAGHEDAISRLRHAIEHATADDEPSHYLSLEDQPSSRPDLHVQAEEGRYRIYDPDGVLLVDPVAFGQLQADAGQPPAVRVRIALESIVRYRSIVTFHNEDPTSALAGKISLRLRRYIEEPGGRRTEDLPAEVVGPGGELTLYFDPEHEERNVYVVDVINASDCDVYPHVFTLSPDFGIECLHPPRDSGISEAVRTNKDGTPYPIGLQAGTVPLKFYLPPGWDGSRD
jgi:hypothetical protein